MKISFTFDGVPGPKPRPRIGKSHIYSPKAKNVDTLKFAAWRARPQKLLTGPLRMTLYVYYKSPNRKRIIYKSSRPDIDNILKTVMDACRGLIYKDDAQIACCKAEKNWGFDNKTIVEIEEIE